MTIRDVATVGAVVVCLAAWIIVSVLISERFSRRTYAAVLCLWWGLWAVIWILVLSSCATPGPVCPLALRLQDPTCQNGIVAYQVRGDSLYPPKWETRDTIHVCTYTFRGGVPQYSGPGDWAYAPSVPPVVEDSAQCATMPFATSNGG